MEAVSEKKRQEFKWVQSFIGLNQKELSGMAVTQSETPDFILQSPRKKISLEVTTLIDPELKKKESLKEKIVRQAREKAGGKYPDGLHVHVSFASEDIICRANEIDRYAENICSIVDDIYTKNDVKNATGFPSFTQEFTDGLISSVSVWPNQKQTHWSTEQSFAFAWIDPDALVKRIREKETILKKYAKHFNENWLLLVANLWDESSSYDFTNIKKRVALSTPFHRVCIYQWMDNRFVKLK
ncbi:MAG: hypothetical protein J0I09_08090 [Sphingobacteriia bacterium]|nr:hypothetical protein [Sphingobacteriia bacterium]